LHEHQRYDGFYPIDMACKLFFAPLCFVTQLVMKAKHRNADVRREKPVA